MSEHDDAELELENRFASLEEASRGLSGDVNALNETLLVVADLSRKQREQAIKQTQTEEEIRKAKQAGDARDARTRNATRFIALTLAVLIPLASVLVYASLLVHVNDLLSSQNADRYISCNIRNEATIENQRREEALGRLETDEAIKQVHFNSAAELSRSLVDCEQYQPTS